VYNEQIQTQTTIVTDQKVSKPQEFSVKNKYLHKHEDDNREEDKDEDNNGEEDQDQDEMKAQDVQKQLDAERLEHIVQIRAKDAKIQVGDAQIQIRHI
jgi:hypothetical protein